MAITGWMVHAWVVPGWESPNGVSSHENPELTCADGTFHTDALHTIERFTRIDKDQINYEITMEDPNVFTKPWTIRMPLYRHVNADARLNQFKCVEFVEELMYGQYRKEPVK